MKDKTQKPQVSRNAKPTVSREIKDRARDGHRIGQLCWQKAMGIISLEARELIMLARTLDNLDEACNPEDYGQANRDIRTCTNVLDDEIHKAERMLTGLDKDFFNQWTREREALNKRMAHPELAE